MIKLNIKNNGESLVEVLVAVGIIVAVLIAVLMLINRAISTNISIKNKILSINIAREGVEGVRNVRDTNWLKYSGDRRNKWLCLDEINTATNPDTIINCSNIASNGKYIVDFNNDTSRFFAKKELTQSSDLSLSTGNTSLFDKYLLYKDSSTSRYTHDDNSGANSSTIFYRQIQLEIDNPPECDDPIPTDAYECTGNSRLHIVSKVQWIEPIISGNQSSQSDLIGTTVMETYLYDYFGRDEY